MKLAELTWKDVDALSRETVVLIPTGSLEQHGPHLPVFTDSLIVTAVAEGVEKRLPKTVLLTPTLWQGASAHHLSFPGTISASFEGYRLAIEAVVESFQPHGFRRFYVINGHGGNSEPNGVAFRGLKERFPTCAFAHSNYYSFVEAEVAGLLEGPAKNMRHACEAEASLAMHLFGGLVRTSELRDDGLESDPPIRGLVCRFDEMTEEGSYGYATLATAAKGKAIYEAAVAAVAAEMEAFGSDYCMKGATR